MSAGYHFRHEPDVPTERVSDTQKASHDKWDRDLTLRIVMSSMPLLGLVLGVVGLALWTAG